MNREGVSGGARLTLLHNLMFPSLFPQQKESATTSVPLALSRRDIQPGRVLAIASLGDLTIERLPVQPTVSSTLAKPGCGPALLTVAAITIPDWKLPR